MIPGFEAARIITTLSLLFAGPPHRRSRAAADMAGRFLLQKLAASAGMSGSTNRIGAHASSSAAAAAGAPVVPHASGAARHFNTFSRSRAAAVIDHSEAASSLDSVGGVKLPTCSPGVSSKLRRFLGATIASKPC
ncbi:hypothetical protein SETIT_6G211900v2 [Setaria italica]|uniref:Uncharacterized protein n=1 Tax=Setaria italica TaxID=4555 RepID=A0A368RP23_SETIT|nr:uncharacterized protein LOC101766147 [Setaria italica]RCV31863.1 hypothetical protein SETIT_6G211900v2 [Setaria italica]